MDNLATDKNTNFGLSICDRAINIELTGLWTYFMLFDWFNVFANCQINIFYVNQIDYFPSKNGAECIDGIDSYSCSCPTNTGYKGKYCDGLCNFDSAFHYL